MNKNIITYLIPIFIGLIILGGVIYFIALFWGGSDKKEASLDDFKSSTDIYSSKKQAYDSYIDDSLVSVRQENVSVNLNSLFSEKREETPGSYELIPENETSPSEIKEPEVKQVSKPSVKKTYPAPSYSQDQTPQEKPTASVKEAKELRRESFNSFSQTSSIQADAKALVVRAVVHTKQTVYDGATVKLRAVSSFPLNGIVIPENTLIYGVASVVQERVAITIKTVSFNNSIIPVSLHAYDRDGIEGIYIPGLVQHELKNESVDEVLSETQSSLHIPRLATVPLTVARNRNRVTEAILTDNYEIILK
jgi:hypothetical protein